MLAGQRAGWRRLKAPSRPTHKSPQVNDAVPGLHLSRDLGITVFIPILEHSVLLGKETGFYIVA